MITGKLSTGQTIHIPQRWEEVTVAQYAAIQGKQNNDLLSAFTGLPLSTLELVPETDLISLWQVLYFASEEIPYVEPSAAIRPVIALESIAQFERAKDFLTKYNLWDCAPNVYTVYFGPKLEKYPIIERWYQAVDQYAAEVIDHKPITEIYSMVLFIVQEINRFLTKYKPLFDKKPEGNEEAAGIHRLAKYGFFLTLVNKCQGDPTRYGRMLQTPADTFYMTLSVEQETADYQKELHRLNNLTNK